MTTHDNTTDNPSTLDAEGSPPAAEAEPTATQAEPTATQAEPTSAEAEPRAAETTQPMTPVFEPATEGATTDDSLFADDNRTGLRSRWDELQASFVDDPKQCVEKADSLVAEVVDQLTASFSDARSRLEAQWARGEEASTEDLRVALKRYRAFFQRLLSV